MAAMSKFGDGAEIFNGTTSDFQQENALPFPAPLFYSMNGDAKAKGNKAAALYFGGWATDKKNMDDLLQREQRKLLAGLVPAESEKREGGSYEVYTTRALVISPLTYRQSWIVDKARFPKFVEGGRRHVQVVVELAEISKDGKISYWGPAVLSSKGYQAKNLITAIGDWEKHTAVIRATEAPGYPAWAFWCSVGTFGANRIQEMVGSGDKKSPITPLSLAIPEMTVELLEKLYITPEVVSIWQEHYAKCKDWKAAWARQTSGESSQRETASADDLPDEIY